MSLYETREVRVVTVFHRHGYFGGICVKKAKYDCFEERRDLECYTFQLLMGFNMGSKFWAIPSEGPYLFLTICLIMGCNVWAFHPEGPYNSLTIFFNIFMILLKI